MNETEENISQENVINDEQYDTETNVYFLFVDMLLCTCYLII